MRLLLLLGRLELLLLRETVEEEEKEEGEGM